MMKITLNNKQINLVEPEHNQRHFMQETKFAIKNLPNAVANTETFMGVGAATAALFIPMDNVSKIILASFAAGAMLAGVATNELKSHYNSPKSENLFENEFRAYIENFTQRRFKKLFKLEKAKKHASNSQLKNLENQQKQLIQDTAEVLLGYLFDINEQLQTIEQQKNSELFNNQYVNEETIKRIKTAFAETRVACDADKFYLLKVIGENLDLFDFCKIETKNKIKKFVLFDYELYLMNKAAIDEYASSCNIDQKTKTLLASYNKLDMEERDRDCNIFVELGIPYEYERYGTKKELRDVIDRHDKFIYDLNMEQDVLSTAQKMFKELFDETNEANVINNDAAACDESDERLQ